VLFVLQRQTANWLFSPFDCWKEKNIKMKPTKSVGMRVFFPCGVDTSYVSRMWHNQAAYMDFFTNKYDICCRFYEMLVAFPREMSNHYKKMGVKTTRSWHWNVQIDKCYLKHMFFVIMHIHGEFCHLLVNILTSFTAWNRK
jgi:hypothetical protein